MSLNEAEKSQAKKDFEKGATNVAGDHRKVKSAVRKTAIGKAIAHQTEKERMKSDLIKKANLKTKDDKKDDDESWESAEEDAPVIRLEELLDNMKIEGEDEIEGDEDDEEEEKE